MSSARTYTLLGADRKPYQSPGKGQWGGHRRTRIYGRLDCPAALRAIAGGGYARYRVFFADEASAIAAGYRPCGTCCADRYQEWKNTRAALAATSRRTHGERPSQHKPRQYPLQTLLVSRRLATRASWSRSRPSRFIPNRLESAL
jgi:methylphosphotriester-DNA--protein-cysteine methyltransferase